MLDKAVLIAEQFPVVSFKDYIPEGFKPVKDMREKAKFLQHEYADWERSFEKVQLGDDWWEKLKEDRTQGQRPAIYD